MNWQKYLTGFVLGAGTAALGAYVYSKNKEQIHGFLKDQGIDIPMAGGGPASGSMSLEELVREKEKLEDIIAEREMAAQADASRGQEAAKGKKAAK